MKIGILTSGNDMITLFSFLQRYDHEYYIWYDDACGFWGDKSEEIVMDRIQQGINFLQNQWVENILVPPIIELKIHNEKLFPKTNVIPLFSNYIEKFCFQYSIIGKIGFFWDWFDLQEAQQQFSLLAKNHILSENQTKIKKFHFPFAYRGKEVRNWKYLLDTCSWSMPLINHTIKQDLRYFKDAGVDTIIPCNYSYFAAQKAIEKARYTKMRFYGIQTLEQIFSDATSGQQSHYATTIYHTGHGEFLLKQKRYLRKITRGKSIEIKTQKIEQHLS
jgi:hypothetical protein